MMIAVSTPTANLPALGLWLFPDASAGALVDAVVRAEELGFDEVWVADEGVMREPSVVLAAAAVRTTRIRLGVGITTPLLRHPGALAATWATIDELSGGRAMLGLGVGGDLSLAPFGIAPERPVGLIRDAIRTVRAVTERVDGSAYTVPAHAAPARRVPVFVASKGAQINRMASREADGVLLSGFDLDRLDEPLAWVRSARPVDVALYASVRFRADAPADPTALRGDAAEIAAGLRALVGRHSPSSIGLALIDGDPVGEMVEQAGEVRRLLSSRG
jgi:5,10-methylenetetrahydromethanopterin reductase